MANSTDEAVYRYLVQEVAHAFRYVSSGRADYERLAEKTVAFMLRALEEAPDTELDDIFAGHDARVAAIEAMSQPYTENGDTDNGHIQWREIRPRT